ncbi:uncharacterized protein LOC142339432 isoform X2 [Convolutriloba macropyga]|uniref:uncharacterized protein LOC142339432 isoform X2 n=1 Tax=Convolutriloba macropyga TaxID=536237 RepID=UPI003F51BE89
MWGGVISDDSSDGEDVFTVSSNISTATSTNCANQLNLMSVKQYPSTVNDLNGKYNICNDLEPSIDLNCNFAASSEPQFCNHVFYHNSEGCHADSGIALLEKAVVKAPLELSSKLSSFIRPEISAHTADNDERNNNLSIGTSHFICGIDFNANETSCVEEREVVYLSDDTDCQEQNFEKKTEGSQIILNETTECFVESSTDPSTRNDMPFTESKKYTKRATKCVTDRELKSPKTTDKIKQAKMKEKTVLKPSKYISKRRVNLDCFQKLYAKRKHELKKELDKLKTCSVCRTTFKSCNSRIKHELKVHPSIIQSAPTISFSINDEAGLSESTKLVLRPLTHVKPHFEDTNVAEQVSKPRFVNASTSASCNADVLAIFRCEGCRFEFASEHQMKNHFTIIHDRADLYQCKYCNLKCDLLNTDCSPNKSWLSTHESKYALNEHFQRCTVCGALFYKNEKAFERHISMHADDENFKCNICNLELKNFQKLKSHVSQQVCWVRGEKSCVLQCITEQKLAKSFTRNSAFKQSSAISVSANIQQVAYVKQKVAHHLPKIIELVPEKQVFFPQCICTEKDGNVHWIRGHSKKCRHRRIYCPQCGKEIQFQYLELHKRTFCVARKSNDEDMHFDASAGDSTMAADKKRVRSPKCKCSQMDSCKLGKDGHHTTCRYRRINCQHCGKELQLNYLETHKARCRALRKPKDDLDQNITSTNNCVLSFEAEVVETENFSSGEKHVSPKSVSNVIKSENMCCSELLVDEMLTVEESHNDANTNFGSKQFGNQCIDDIVALEENENWSEKRENELGSPPLKETVTCSVARISVSKVISLARTVETTDNNLIDGSNL